MSAFFGRKATQKEAAKLAILMVVTSSYPPLSTVVHVLPSLCCIALSLSALVCFAHHDGSSNFDVLVSTDDAILLFYSIFCLY